MSRALVALLLLVFAGFLACSPGESTVPMGGAQTQEGTAVPEAGLENPSIFWADPQVIQSCDDDLGQTTLHWRVPGANRLEVRVGDPKGPLFCLSGPEGSKETENWVRDGMVFYLLEPDTGRIVATCKVEVSKAGC